MAFSSNTNIINIYLIPNVLTLAALLTDWVNYKEFKKKPFK